ncbi:hypothetical protein ACQCTC_13610, partial [Ralstonia pseudosolanacearum]
MPAPTPRSPPMLARNVTHFVRLLRGAGMPLAPSRAVDAIEALGHIDIGRRDDVRAALAALLVAHPDERILFDAAFNLFWRDPDWEGKLRALLQLQEVTPDAMLVDIEMPHMDGFDLT